MQEQGIVYVHTTFQLRPHHILATNKFITIHQVNNLSKYIDAVNLERETRNSSTTLGHVLLVYTISSTTYKYINVIPPHFM